MSSQSCEDEVRTREAVMLATTDKKFDRTSALYLGLRLGAELGLNEYTPRYRTTHGTLRYMPATNWLILEPFLKEEGTEIVRVEFFHTIQKLATHFVAHRGAILYDEYGQATYHVENALLDGNDANVSLCQNILLTLGVTGQSIDDATDRAKERDGYALIFIREETVHTWQLLP